VGGLGPRGGFSISVNGAPYWELHGHKHLLINLRPPYLLDSLIHPDVRYSHSPRTLRSLDNRLSKECYYSASITIISNSRARVSGDCSQGRCHASGALNDTSAQPKDIYIMDHGGRMVMHSPLTPVARVQLLYNIYNLTQYNFMTHKSETQTSLTQANLLSGALINLGYVFLSG